MKMKRTQRVRLGRKVTDSDYIFMDSVIMHLHIDVCSGIGYRGLTSKGEIVPRCYQINEYINRDLQRNGHDHYPKPPVKLFAGHADHQIDEFGKVKTVAFFASHVNDGEIVVCFDFDNKKLIPYEYFYEDVKSFVENVLGFENCFIQKSTNFKGCHAYTKIQFDSDPNLNMDAYVRDQLTTFSKFVKQMAIEQDISFDRICGMPTVYGDDGLIKTRCTWAKVPYGLNNKKTLQKFLQTSVIKLEDIEFFNRNFENADVGELIDGPEIAIKPAAKITNIKLDDINGRNDGSESNFSEPSWDIRSALAAKITKLWNSDRIPFKNGWLSVHEAVDYVMALELSGLINKNAKKAEHLQGTNPMKSVKALYDRNRMLGKHLQKNVYQDSKAAYVRNMMEAHGLVEMIDRTYKPAMKDEDGNVVSEGIAAKWYVRTERLREWATEEEMYSSSKCFSVGLRLSDAPLPVFDIFNNYLTRIYDFDPVECYQEYVLQEG